MSVEVKGSEIEAAPADRLERVVTALQEALDGSGPDSWIELDLMVSPNLPIAIYRGGEPKSGDLPSVIPEDAVSTSIQVPAAILPEAHVEIRGKGTVKLMTALVNAVTSINADSCLPVALPVPTVPAA